MLMASGVKYSTWDIPRLLP